MAFVTAVADVQDSTGASIVRANPDGTRPALALKADASMTVAYAKVGDIGVVTVGANGTAVVTSAAVIAAVAGQDVALDEVTASQITTGGNITVGGALDVAGTLTVTELIFEGGLAIKTTEQTIVGNASAVVLALPLANNSIARLVGFSCLGFAAGAPDVLIFSDGGTPLVFAVIGGSLATVFGSISRDTFSCGLPPSLDASWAGGVLTLTLTGPQIAVTGVADNGSGHPRVTCASGSLTGDLSGARHVDISGIVGTGDSVVNGTNLAPTQITATTFDLLGLSWASGTYSSGGLVALHTPLTFALTTTAILTVAPAP